MRATSALTASCLLVVATGVAAVPQGIKELPGLSLSGEGCRVRLHSSDGSVICTAIATPLPSCFPFTAYLTGDDGGTRRERYRLGSSCPPPRLSSADLGEGSFLVESSGVVYSVICDSASECLRSQYYARIKRCCAEESSIQGTPVCIVSESVEACMPKDESGSGDFDATDGGERSVQP